jgi:hypothetical protein
VVTATGVRSRGDRVDAVWALSWPEQHATGINPIIIRAFYSAGAHHPNLQGGTVGDWALNVFDEEQAAAELTTLRAIASADIHNLVFQRDYRIIPAMSSGPNTLTIPPSLIDARRGRFRAHRRLRRITTTRSWSPDPQGCRKALSGELSVAHPSVHLTHQSRELFAAISHGVF